MNPSNFLKFFVICRLNGYGKGKNFVNMRNHKRFPVWISLFKPPEKFVRGKRPNTVHYFKLLFSQKQRLTPYRNVYLSDLFPSNKYLLELSRNPLIKRSCL